ncbi:hypothetical protein PMAYCL1PPCAC_07006, partial [Pristionchus mayeri]
MIASIDIALRSQPKGSSPQLVAIALMHRLHILCVQLFLTILQVIGERSEEDEATVSSSSTVSSPPSIDESRKIRRLAEIEAKVLITISFTPNHLPFPLVDTFLLIRMLRHVTSPLVRVRPLEPRRSRRGHPASRPPSPQLFAIDEE